MLKYLKPYRLAAGIALILMLVELVVELWHPVLMARIIDEGILPRDTGAVLRIGAWMTLLALLGFASGIVNSYFAAHVSQGFAFDVRAGMYERVQSFPYAVFSRFSAATLMTRMTSDVAQVQNAVFMSLRVMMRAPLIMAGGLIMALAINVRLGLVLLLISPVLFTVLVWMMNRGFKLFQAVQARLDRTNGLLRENLLGMRLIKAMVRYARERERFMQANEDLMTRTISAIRVVELTVPALLMVMNVGILLLLWFGSAEVQAGRAEVGEIVAVVNYAMRIMAAFSMLSWIVTGLARARASAGRITEVLKTEEKETTTRAEGSGEDGRQENAASSPSAPDEGAEIAFERVTFRYPGMADPALDRISFTVRPGQTAAILGATGSGKSSLIQLIPRLFDPDEGAVRIDGRDVRTCDPEWLRAQIGYAPQEVVLFSGTVRDNLLWGKDDANREEIVEAARAAQIHETIMRLPNQYETMIGQKGVNLSGGQKQRLSVARALLRKPRVLLLDDSTSALDAKTEAALLAALKAYRCTILLVTQKISAAMQADVILILEDGRLHAMGTHEELLRTSPLYARIIRSQYGEEAAHRG
ncbi:ABC-type multidrug transport system, ATPase and permease component [Thermobacillus composti KWC4]|uniref:ABC-type multidrug transport system, ATPase and permease component n=1 Tax=Thermobacillus composti (strain DSM 18247 / JCM 13945 / KWC4) TaxID=717605 RepID=L0EJU7_THECK|nr:ABC-type multidrug transport system, ATPase and permease component [Thermobacillus composti KWC4]